MRYKIKKWSDYQHYKDRCPPWIKLHHALLTSEVWVMSNDATRTLAVACMLLASRNDDNDGTFNGDPEYIKRFAYLNTKPDFKPLIELGFIECLQDASTALDKCNTEQSREEQSRADVPAKKSSKNTSIPKDFSVSEQVKLWAEKNGHTKLNERLNHFILCCEAKNYQYSNWDSAFRKAISDDWAKLGKIEVKINLDCPKGYPFSDWMKASQSEKLAIIGRHNVKAG